MDKYIVFKHPEDRKYLVVKEDDSYYYIRFRSFLLSSIVQPISKKSTNIKRIIYSDNE